MVTTGSCGRALLAGVLTAGLLAACGAGSPESGPRASDAPDGITSVEWPRDATAVRTIVAAVPKELDGWTAKPVRPDEDGEGFSVDYHRKDGEVRRPEAFAMAADRERGPVHTMLGMLLWSGGPEGCLDLTGSPEVLAAVAAMRADPEAVWTPAPTSTGAAVEWLACRSVVNVDGGPDTLPPDEQQAILLWTGGGRLYGAIGRTTEQRDALASAMVAAASG